MDSSGPVPAHVGRKPEQPDVEIGLDLLSQLPEEDSGAGPGLGSLAGGGEALVTTPDRLPGRRVPELPLDAEEAALEHPQPVASVLVHALHQPHGNALDLEPLQQLTGDPGLEHPCSVDVGPGLELPL